MQLTNHGSHLDHMLKQTRQHHVELSSMADKKANMLITVSSLIITLSIGYISDPIFRWPAVVIIFFCIGTIFTAAYAAMPKVDLKQMPNFESQRFNPLFFASFMHMEYDEYRELMNDLLDHPDSVYELQVRELYQMGVFLGHKKYRFIRYSYAIFIVGIVVSVVLALLIEINFLLSTGELVF